MKQFLYLNFYAFWVFDSSCKVWAQLCLISSQYGQIIMERLFQEINFHPLRRKIHLMKHLLSIVPYYYCSVSVLQPSIVSESTKNVEMRKQIVQTTLIRDQNGLGFSIAGGKGCPPFKDNSDVSQPFFTFSFFLLPFSFLKPEILILRIEN